MARRESGVTLRLWVSRPYIFRTRSEFCSRADPELAVGAGQVGLNRLQADEQGSRDLSVGHPAGCQLGDLALGRSQVLRSPAETDPVQLQACLGAPGRRPKLLEDSQSVGEGIPRRPSLLGASQEPAVDAQVLAMFQRHQPGPT